MELELSSILDIFKKRYGLLIERKIRVEITDNIYLRYAQLRPNDNVASGEAIGKMVLPDPEDGTFYILLCRSLMEDEFEFIECLTHEMCHLYDYLAFSDYYCENYIKMATHQLFAPFFIFSEFKAKALGYLCEHDFLCNQHVKQCDEDSNFSINLNSALIEAQKEMSNKGYQAIYHGTRFLGKLYAQIDLLHTPDISEEYTNFMICENSKEMYRLYLFLSKHFNSNISTIDFSVLRNLFNSAFFGYSSI